MFSSLSNSERHKLVDALSSESANAGDVILKEGDIGTKFYILIHGIVKIYSKGVLIGELGQVTSYICSKVLL